MVNNGVFEVLVSEYLPVLTMLGKVGHQVFFDNFFERLSGCVHNLALFILPHTDSDQKVDELIAAHLG